MGNTSEAKTSATVSAKVGGAFKMITGELSGSMSSETMRRFEQCVTSNYKQTYNLEAPEDESWYLYKPVLTATMFDGQQFSFSGGLFSSNEPQPLSFTKTFSFLDRLNIPKGDFRLLN